VGLGVAVRAPGWTMIMIVDCVYGTLFHAKPTNLVAQSVSRIWPSNLGLLR
jgi:hypothetical protein